MRIVIIHSEYLYLFYRNRHVADENSHRAVGRHNANRGRSNSRSCSQTYRRKMTV